MTLRIFLLAELQVADDVANISRSLRPRARRLLAYLLLERGRPRGREQIAFALWPDHTEKAALGALRRALSELRAALPPLSNDQWILETTAGLRWNVEAPFWLDIASYERLLLGASPAGMHEAIDLYTGHLLAGWDEEWLVARRELLRQKQFEALRGLAAHHRSVGDAAVALEFARRAAEFDPLSEPASRDLMRLFYELGDRAAALTEYERIRVLLMNELGVEPMAKTRALHLAIVQEKELPDTELPSPIPVQAAGLSLPPIFGRQEESAQLRKLWDTAMDGGGQIAVISGEAGIGKSLLVGRLAEVAAGSGGLPLIGNCYEFVQALPFQPVLAMLRPATSLLRTLGLAAAHRAALGQLAPDIVGEAAEADADYKELSPHRREQLFEGLLQGFIALARQQPVLLLLEDAHWADESTLDWLAYSAARLQAVRLLALITYRTDALHPAHGLARLERRFAQDQRITRISIPPLSKEDSSALVANMLGLEPAASGALANRLFHRSGGNPFFLQELVRSIRESGQIGGENQDAGDAAYGAAPIQSMELPDSLRAAIDARVALLSERSKMYLRTAAVAGRIFDHEIIRRAEDWPEEQALAAIEELLQKGLVRAEENGSFSFAHHLVQEAIYAGLAPPRRTYLHRQLAGAIQERQPDDVEALVHHSIQAGEHTAAIQYCFQATRRSWRVFAYEEGVGYCELALSVMDEDTDPEEKVAILEELGDNLRMLRDGQRAVSIYNEALEIWRDTVRVEPISGIRLYRKVLETTAGMWGRTGFSKFEEAAQVSEALRSSLAEVLPSIRRRPSHAETVRLLKALANDALVTQFPPALENAMDFAQQAVDLARHLESPVELSQALAILGGVHAAHGRYRETVAFHRQRLELSREPEFDDPREALRILNGLGSALVHVGDYRDAVTYLREAEALAQRLRAVDLQTQALSLLHQCWFRLDQWEAAKEIEDKRQQLLREYTLEQLGSPCYSIALSSVLHFRRGDLARARQLHRESNEIMTGISGPPERWTRSQHF